MKIAIHGSSGFIGAELKSYFERENHEVMALSRHEKVPEDMDVLINLAGSPIFGRWTKKKKEEIWKSRIDFTKKIKEELLQLKKPPSLYIGASAIGYYGDRGDQIAVEESPYGTGFLAEVCKAWELSCQKMPCRAIHARFGIVLDQKGGILKKMTLPFKWGLGGTFSDGKQWMSWIALEDLLRGIDFVIKDVSISGPCNFTSPEPITNQVFTKHIAKALHRPAFFSVPSWLIKWVFGEASTLFLASTKAKPQKLLLSGFDFKFPDLESFLKDSKL